MAHLRFCWFSLSRAVLWIQHTRGLKWVDARDPGTQYRLLMWKDGARLAVQHPLFGVGMDSVQNRWPEWHLRRLREISAVLELSL